MSLEPASAVALVAGAFAAVSLGYWLLAVAATLHFARRPRPPAGFAPPITLLKPLCGLDFELYENLRSFCEQRYPEFQIVFGARDPDDPALAVVERLRREFPGLDVAVVVDPRLIGANHKASNLAHMMRAAKHQILFAADSDVRVPPGYLASVVAGFADPGVGAVTCAYTASAPRRLASELGAMFINDWFLPSALIYARIGRLRSAFGQTLCIRRELLEAIGGFEAVAGRLADDYWIARWVNESGRRVELSTTLVDNVVEEPGLRGLFLHELRWARTIRRIEPRRYALCFLTYPLPVTALAAAAVIGVGGPAAPALALVAVALCARLGQHALVRRVFGVRGRATPWLVPLRDLLGLAVWAASYAGRRVHWRGFDFELAPDGRIAPRAERPSPGPRAAGLLD
jgi:ceramide glucosyltransferase